jgi:hypothetical protein
MACPRPPANHAAGLPSRLVTLAAVGLAVAGCSSGPAPGEADCGAITSSLRPLLDARWSGITGSDGLSEAWRAARNWIERQLVTHDEWVSLGWCDLREARLTDAQRAFSEARGRVRHSSDALIGLGHVALRAEEPAEGARQFSAALTILPTSPEAREGLRLSLERLPAGDPAAVIALDALRRPSVSRAGVAGDGYLMAMADQRAGGSGEIRRRPDAPRDLPEAFARAGRDYLELRGDDGAWTPIFVQGVNLGPALPGRFASEPPEDEATWSGWLDLVAGLGANAVRVYTLQPPAFYRALATHNARAAGSPLWLFQGVWADLPPADDFDDAAYVADFEAAIARAIDAVHGDLALEPARGTARGLFDADVSGFTLGWIVGREWEPFAVAGFEKLRPGPCSYDGRFVRVETGRAMECWIGRMLDFTASYEARRYGAARPLTFANWPTLDPLDHPTEATRDEEDRWRHALDGVPLPARTSPPWDDDAVSVDATLLSPTDRFPPGVFASYHVYPNFPYFMNLEPGYAEVRDAHGPNRYGGYLRALKAYHGTQPVLVAEFGMSTSRGIAHLQPEGLHHGGHDEAEAMRENARLLHTIHAENLAGGIAFEFMDEWFKGTWSTSPFEVPEEHRPRWFNAESPEQSYGLFAMRPARPVRIDGDARDWREIAALATAVPAPAGWSGLTEIKATYDAGWLYVLLQTAGTGAPDWKRLAISLGIDTYDAERGERQLPAPADCNVPTGVEFAVTLRGPDASGLLVTPPYRPRHPAESGTAVLLYSPERPTGGFVSPSLETNRERYTRAGERIPAQRVLPGVLRFGSLDPQAADFDTRTDVAVGTGGAIELRLPWALLNFADPSTAAVLHSTAPAATFGTVKTEGIRLYACARERGSPTGLQSLQAAPLRIEPWAQPAHEFEAKAGLDQLRQAFLSIGGKPPPRSATGGQP